MAGRPEALSASVSLPVPDDTGQDSPAPHGQARERTRADPREPGHSRADLEYAPPDPEHEALAASLPQEWVKAAESRYSMHGSGLVRNLLAGAVPLIRAAERERLAAVIPPERFRSLADWFDTDDEFKTAMFPETWPQRGHETQDDLRKFADLLGTGEENRGN